MSPRYLTVMWGFLFSVVFIIKHNTMTKKIRLSETDLVNLIKNVINEQPSSSNTVTNSMIQPCKMLLNNVPGGSPTWKQNMKQAVLGKSCMWVRNRMSHFGQKMNQATPGSGAWARFRAKTMFLECLLNEVCR